MIEIVTLQKLRYLQVTKHFQNLLFPIAILCTYKYIRKRHNEK